MSLSSGGEQGTGRRLPQIKGWFIVLAGLAFGTAYLYYLHIEERKDFINSYYFRTLQEVATEFNNNLGQLETLHRYGQSISTIQSIFTSYKPEGIVHKTAATENSLPAKEPDCPATQTDAMDASGKARKSDVFVYTLEANRVKIERNPTSDCVETFFVDISDLMPEPGNDFVIYVIADGNNRVLGSTGGEAGLSMINTEVISRAIQLRENQDWMKLATKEGGEGPKPGISLPGYSTQIDIDLNTGKSRVFVLPFVLFHKFSIPELGSNSRPDGTKIELPTTDGVPLYLVGVQPDKVIESYENKRWNFSLLLLSLVALVFIWTFTRLLMLSRHQPLGNGFYRVVVVSSYLTFILLVALLVALIHRNGEIELRKQQALNLIATTSEGVEADLYDTFASLDEFHRFYSRLLSEAPGDGSLDLKCSTSALECSGLCMLVELEERYEICTHQQVSIENLADVFKAHSLKTPDPVLVKTPGKSELPLPKFTNINVYPPGARVELNGQKTPPTESSKDEIEVRGWFDIPDVDGLPAEGRLLGVFLMDESGQQVPPLFYFTENNLKPQKSLLAHRDYFRRVRDRAGWTIDLNPGQNKADTTSEAKAQPPRVFENVYIQRLLNLRTGTRGSTIGMPLEVTVGEGRPVTGGAYFLGADIALPTLSLAEWRNADDVQDMVIMVIDRVSGQVLYHMDDKRSMVENLYQSGRGAAEISQEIQAGRIRDRAIQAGRDRDRDRDRAVPGYYHGEAGVFMAGTLPISQWVTVVFIPDASTDSLMTDTFLVSAIGMGAVLLLWASLLGLARSRFDTETHKSHWGLPVAVNGHGLMLFASVLLASIYLAFWLGEVVSKLPAWKGWPNLPFACILLAMAIVLWWGCSVLRRLQRQDWQWASLQARASHGVVLLLAVFALTGLGMAWYLHHVGNKPDSSLSWYYRNLAIARLNQEKMELHEIALARYPNTIKQHARDSLQFLPISPEWRDCLSLPTIQTVKKEGPKSNSESDAKSESGSDLRTKQPNVLPEHIGTYSQYTARTDAWSWLKRSMLTAGRDSSNSLICQPKSESVGPAAQVGNVQLSIWRLVSSISAFLLLCATWYLFYRRVLGARLFGAVGLAEHLRHIVERNVPERAYSPRPGLVLDLHCQRHAGEDFGALLQRCAADETKKKLPDLTCQGIDLLLQACPWLLQGANDSDPFPGANVSFRPVANVRPPGSVGDASEQKIAIQLSDLDVCLSQAAVRKSLLHLLRQLKAMCLAGQLAELRINLGFHSYESLLLKAHNTDSEKESMSQAEYADWAETLMDFRVELPAELTGQLDPAFVKFECRGSGLLRGLEAELLGDQAVPDAEWRQLRRWLNLSDVDKTGREWASINCILLKAGALFRHKWETCSSAEKLALYYLARKKRINSANAQLLEQMSLQGLIRVDHGGFRIVNNTFAYFARHAEDTTTLKGLVEIAEVGAWQEFRVPVTLVILLLLGGIAFTSGSSMYMIVASLLGLLGTIGSLTSSARMIKENLR